MDGHITYGTEWPPLPESAKADSVPREDTEHHTMKPAKPKTMRPAAAHRPRTVRERTAILIKPINGVFTHWKAGEQVKVRYVTGARYCLIEKTKLKPSGIFREGLPVLNELAGVPRAVLKFSKKLI